MSTLADDDSEAITTTLGVTSINRAREMLLKEAYTTLRAVAEGDGTRNASCGDAQMELFSFCEECLRGDLLASARTLFDAAELASCCVLGVLRSMRYGRDVVWCVV